MAKGQNCLWPSTETYLSTSGQRARRPEAYSGNSQTHDSLGPRNCVGDRRRPWSNFVHYDPARVSKLYELEPNPGMIRMAEQQRKRTELNIEFVNLPRERLPLEDNTVDTVVSTFILCTIPGVSLAIQGIRRVLKPEGNFIFFEHGLSPDPDMCRWQRRTEPLFQWAFEGCHVTRVVPTLIEEGGFKIEQIDTAYLAPFPKSGSYCFWGVASPQP